MNAELLQYLPHVNASLKRAGDRAAIDWVCANQAWREQAHIRTMLACFGVSVLFLACYVVYHVGIEGSKKFPDYPPVGIRYTYYFILLTHIVLAALVPFLAVATIWLGLRDRRSAHRRLARWTFPIWLYVSITGVMVYLALYQLYPPLSPGMR